MNRLKLKSHTISFVWALGHHSLKKLFVARSVAYFNLNHRCIFVIEHLGENLRWTFKQIILIFLEIAF